jgi:hypothetical protein
LAAAGGVPALGSGNAGAISATVTSWAGWGLGLHDDCAKANAAAKAPNNKAKLLALFTVTFSPVAVHRHAVALG